MEVEEGKPAIAVIKATSFYSNRREKTKLNWFCYELAMAFYDNIQHAFEKELMECKINDESLAEFSVYLSKKMKGVILQKLAGKIENAYMSYEMVEEYFSNLNDINDILVDKVLDIISKTWDEQLASCEVCPTRCISEKDAYCTMFDKEGLANIDAAQN